MNNKLEASLYTITFFFLTYILSGVFWGVIRTDEIYFIHKAWMLNNGHQGITGIYYPSLFPFILSKITLFFDDSIYVYFYLKSTILALFALTYFIIVKYTTSKVNNRNASDKICLFLFVISIVLYLASMRGFEIRPEAWGNIFLLLSSSYIINPEKTHIKNNKSFAFSIACSVICSLFSVRYAIPAATISLMSIGFYAIRTNHYKSAFIIPALITLGILIIYHFYVESLFDLLTSVINFEDKRGHQNTWRYIIFELGLGHYKPILDKSHLYFSDLIRLFLYTTFSLVLATLTFKSFKNNKKIDMIHYFMLLFLLLSYLMFLRIESKPYNYSASIESILMLVVFLSIYTKFSNKYFIIKLSIVSLIFYSAICGATIINKEQPRLKKLFKHEKSLTARDVKSLSSEELLRKRIIKSETNDSLEQSIIINRFCSIYEGKEVFTKNFRIHPVCMKDTLSHKYWIKQIELEKVEEQLEQKNILLEYNGSFYIYE